MANIWRQKKRRKKKEQYSSCHPGYSFTSSVLFWWLWWNLNAGMQQSCGMNDNAGLESDFGIVMSESEISAAVEIYWPIWEGTQYP